MYNIAWFFYVFCLNFFKISIKYDIKWPIVFIKTNQLYSKLIVVFWQNYVTPILSTKIITFVEKIKFKVFVNLYNMIIYYVNYYYLFKY